MVTGKSLKGLFDMVPIRLAKRKPGEDIAKATTQNDREDVQKARRACGSTMNFAAGCMSNRFLWKINVVIVHLVSAVDKGFVDANKNNRSCTQSAAYWSERAVDKGLPEINGIIAAMAAREVYENTGCHVEGCPRYLFRLAFDDPMVEAEDDVAALVGDFGTALLARRSRTCSLYDGYPFICAGLLNEDKADDVAKTMQLHFDDWLRIQHVPGAVWKKIRNRSTMAREHTKQMMFALRDNAWNVTDDIREKCREQWGGVTQTCIVENAFRTLRMAEVSTNFKKLVSGKRCYATLIKARIESTKFKHTPLPSRHCIIKRGLKSGSTAGLYKPNVKKHQPRLRASCPRRPRPPTSARLRSWPLRMSRTAPWHVFASSRTTLARPRKPGTACWLAGFAAQGSSSRSRARGASSGFFLLDRAQVVRS
jgi:hypothetical protein